MKIALVWPEVLDMARYREMRKEFPPFGAMYLGSALEAQGYTVKLFKLTPDCLTFDFTGFDAVGFSISASAAFNMFMECRFGSRYDKGTLLLAGGVHANLLPEQTLLDLKPDVVGVGEGEETILEIIKAKDSRDFSKIAGVCYLRDGKPTRTQPRGTSRDISKFAFPARHLMDESDLIMNDRMSNTSVRMTHIVPGRGCPFPCRYCASAQTKVQLRSGDNIRSELESLIEKYQIQGFAIVGNDFILSKDNVYDMSEKIADLNLQWATLTRVDRVNNEILRAMKKAGCHEVEYGVESGSQRILDAMDKRATIEEAKYALGLSFDNGIKNKVFLIHGFPGENQESTEETMRFLDQVGHLIERVSLFRWVPLPGTYVYNRALELGIRGTPHDKNWDGDWGKFHIHHNHHHWWGSDKDFEILTLQYRNLREYVEKRWPSKFKLEQLPEDRWLAQSTKFAKTHKANAIAVSAN